MELTSRWKRKKEKIANANPPSSLMGGADENTGSLECSVVHGILEEEQRMLLKFMGGTPYLLKGGQYGISGGSLI